MGLVSRLRAYALTVIAILLAFMPVATHAQAMESYTTPDGAHTVEWTGVWELDRTDSEGQVEAMLFYNDRDGAAMSVLFVPSGQLPIVQIRDIALESFQEGTTDLDVIDSGTYDNVAYELDRFSMDGTPVGMFTLVIDRAGTTGGTTSVTYLAPVDTFAASMSAAQDEVVVDGQPIFTGIEPSSLQEQLGGPATRTTTVANESETSASTGDDVITIEDADSYVDPEWGYVIEFGPVWEDVIEEGDFSLTSSVDETTTVVRFSGFDGAGVPMQTIADTLETNLIENSRLETEITDTIVTDDRVLIVGEMVLGVVIQEAITTPSGQTVLATYVIMGDSDTAVATLQETVSVDGVQVLRDWPN